MIERIKSGARKITITTVAITGASLFAACGSSAENEFVPPTRTLPAGFSDDIADYKYEIIIDGKNDAVRSRLFTNQQPSLNSQGGQNMLIAQDVFCPLTPVSGLDPKVNYSLEEAIIAESGCNRFVEGEYKMTTPYRVIVTENPYQTD